MRILILFLVMNGILFALQIGLLIWSFRANEYRTHKRILKLNEALKYIWIFSIISMTILILVFKPFN